MEEINLLIAVTAGVDLLLAGGLHGVIGAAKEPGLDSESSLLGRERGLQTTPKTT